MKIIYKYKMGISTTHEMPIGAEFLSFQSQHDEIRAWFLVDLSSNTEPRKFYIYGTGHQLLSTDCLKYLGTAQQDDFVWHLFEEKN